MNKPSLLIDCSKLHNNAKKIRQLADKRGVKIFGVTKSFSAAKEIAEIFLQAGFHGLADARWQNLERLQRSNFHCPLMMIRLPAMGEIEEVIRYSDMSLVTEIDTVRALAQTALKNGRVYQVIIMVEMGDRREGVPMGQVADFCQQITRCSGIELIGLGANYGCINGVQPSMANMFDLADLAVKLEKKFNLSLPHLSSGNSSAISLLREENIPQRINFMRLGHDILMGIDGSNYKPIPDLEQNIFTVRGQILELQRKPSLPEGRLGLDAWGNPPQPIVDCGEQLRGLVNLGRIDVNPDSLLVKDKRINIIGASSDLMVLDMTKTKEYRVGDEIEFIPNYPAMVQAWLSPYLEKIFVYSDGYRASLKSV